MVTIPAVDSAFPGAILADRVVVVPAALAVQGVLALRLRAFPALVEE